MRILISCLQSNRPHPLPAYGFWREYFLNGCLEAGIEPVEIPGLDWAEGLTLSRPDELHAWQSRTWDTVLDFVRRETVHRRIDLFLSYLFPQQIDPAAIAELQRLGVPCVNFFCDNVREFHRVPDEFRPFALHWVPELEAVPLYRAAALDHIHAPMPCWVPLELRLVVPRESEPPTFIGSADVLRRDLLGRAVQAGADLTVRGPGWKGSVDAPSAPLRPMQVVRNQVALLRTHGARAIYHKLGRRLRPLRPPRIADARTAPGVGHAEYVRITRDAIVTIGVNRVPTARASVRRPLAYSRLRDVEAPMLGACYLTEWTAGVEQLYDLGTEIETYRTPEELADRLSRLTKDPARRHTMRTLAQRRALSDHSVPRTLQRICAQLLK